jgi:uncharacterized RmlC-like cupin family protein
MIAMPSVPSVLTPADRKVIPDQQTASLHREQAFAGDDRWVGFIETDPGQWSAWHHHGEHDTYFYVLEGHLQIEFEDDGGLRTAECGPGDFVHVPSQGIHRERTASGPPGKAVLVRIGRGPTVVNVDGPGA